MSLYQQLTLILIVFIVCPSQGQLKYIKTKVLTTWFCAILRTFIKRKVWNSLPYCLHEI